MAWIYFQESVESGSPSASGLEQLPIVSKTDTHKAFYCHECNQVKLIELQSGMTLKHSEEICSHESTLSSVDSLVRISRSQEMERAWQESEAVFSLKSSDSQKNATPDLFSLKTSLPSEPVEGKEWGKNWPASGMIVDGRLYQPPQLEPHTKGKGGSYLPTPTASSYGRNKSREGNKERPSLDTMARKNLWPTPTTQEIEHPDAVLTATGRRLSKNGKSFAQYEPGRLSTVAESANFWATEPGICRVVDGLPNRMDRIRCLGNSVVPFQVKTAFEKLIGL